MGKFKTKLRNADNSVVSQWSPVGEIKNRGLIQSQKTVDYVGPSTGYSGWVQAYNRVNFSDTSNFNGWADEAHYLCIDSNGNKYVQQWYDAGSTYKQFIYRLSPYGEVTGEFEMPSSFEIKDMKAEGLNVYIMGEDGNTDECCVYVVKFTGTAITNMGSFSIPNNEIYPATGRSGLSQPQGMWVKNGKIYILWRISDSFYNNYYINLVRLGSDGTLEQSAKFLTSPAWDAWTRMSIDSSGSMYIYSWSSSNSGGSYVMKLDTSMNILWTRLCPNGIEGFEATNTAMYVYTGNTYAKFNTSFSKLWQMNKVVGNEDSLDNYYDAWLETGPFTLDSSGNVYALSSRISNEDSDDKTGLCILKINGTSGNLEWAQFMSQVFPSAEVIQSLGGFSNKYFSGITDQGNSGIVVNSETNSLDFLFRGVTVAGPKYMFWNKTAVGSIDLNGLSSGEATISLDLDFEYRKSVTFKLYNNINDMTDNPNAGSVILNSSGNVYTKTAWNPPDNSYAGSASVANFTYELSTLDYFGQKTSEAWMFVNKTSISGEPIFGGFDVICDEDGNKYCFYIQDTNPQTNRFGIISKISSSGSRIKSVSITGDGISYVATSLFKALYYKNKKIYLYLSESTNHSILIFDTNLSFLNKIDFSSSLSTSNGDTNFVVDSSGNIYCFYGSTSDGQKAVLVTKINSSGSILFTKKISHQTLSPSDEYSNDWNYVSPSGFSVQQPIIKIDSQNNIYYTNWRDSVIVKIDSNINVIWSKVAQRYSSFYGEWGRSNIAIRDMEIVGNYLYVFYFFGSYPYLKFNINTGQVSGLQELTFPNDDFNTNDPNYVDGLYEYGGSILSDTSGNIYTISAFYYYFPEVYDERGFNGLVIAKFDSNDELQWFKKIYLKIDEDLYDDIPNLSSFWENWINGVYDEASDTINFFLDGELYGNVEGQYKDVFPTREELGFLFSVPASDGGANGEATILYKDSEFWLSDPYTNSFTFILEDIDVYWNTKGIDSSAFRLHTLSYPAATVTNYTAPTLINKTYSYTDNSNPWTGDYFKGGADITGVYVSEEVFGDEYPPDLFYKNGYWYGVEEISQGDYWNAYDQNNPDLYALYFIFYKRDRDLNLISSKSYKWHGYPLTNPSTPYANLRIVDIDDNENITCLVTAYGRTRSGSSYSATLFRAGTMVVDKNFNITNYYLYTTQGTDVAFFGGISPVLRDGKIWVSNQVNTISTNGMYNQKILSLNPYTGAYSNIYSIGLHYNTHGTGVCLGIDDSQNAYMVCNTESVFTPGSTTRAVVFKVNLPTNTILWSKVVNGPSRNYSNRRMTAVSGDGSVYLVGSLDYFRVGIPEGTNDIGFYYLGFNSNGSLKFKNGFLYDNQTKYEYLRYGDTYSYALGNWYPEISTSSDPNNPVMMVLPCSIFLYGVEDINGNDLTIGRDLPTQSSITFFNRETGVIESACTFEISQQNEYIGQFNNIDYYMYVYASPMYDERSVMSTINMNFDGGLLSGRQIFFDINMNLAINNINNMVNGEVGGQFNITSYYTNQTSPPYSYYIDSSSIPYKFYEGIPSYMDVSNNFSISDFPSLNTSISNYPVSLPDASSQLYFISANKAPRNIKTVDI